MAFKAACLYATELDILLKGFSTVSSVDLRIHIVLSPVTI